MSSAAEETDKSADAVPSIVRFPAKILKDFRIEPSRRLSTTVADRTVTLYRRCPIDDPVEMIGAFAVGTKEERHGNHLNKTGWVGISLSPECPTRFIRIEKEPHPSAPRDVGWNAITDVDSCDAALAEGARNNVEYSAIADRHAFVSEPVRRWASSCGDKDGHACRYIPFSSTGIPPSRFAKLDWDTFPNDLFEVVKDGLTHHTIIPRVLLEAYIDAQKAQAIGTPASDDEGADEECDTTSAVETLRRYGTPEALWRELAPTFVQQNRRNLCAYNERLLHAFVTQPYFVLKGGADPTDGFEPSDDDDAESCGIMAELIQRWWPYLDDDPEGQALCYCIVNMHRCNPPKHMWREILQKVSTSCDRNPEASNDLFLADAVEQAEREPLRLVGPDATPCDAVVVMACDFRDLTSEIKAGQYSLFSYDEALAVCANPKFASELAKEIRVTAGSLVLHFHVADVDDALQLQHLLREETVADDVARRAATVVTRDPVDGPLLTLCSYVPSHVKIIPARLKIHVAVFRFENKATRADISRHTQNNTQLWKLLLDVANSRKTGTSAQKQRIFSIFLADNRPLDVERMVDSLFPTSNSTESTGLQREALTWLSRRIPQGYVAASNSWGLSPAGYVVACPNSTVLEMCVGMLDSLLTKSKIQFDLVR